MFYSIKSRLVASFIGVSFFVGAVSLLVGGDLLTESVLGEAKNRVGLDLNAANEVYRNRIKQVEVSLNITTLGYGFILALKNKDVPDLMHRLGRISQYASLDFAGLVNETGEPFCRIGSDSLTPALYHNPIADLALVRKTSVAGTFVLGRDFLLSENRKLAEHAASGGTGERGPSFEDRDDGPVGMAIAASVPVFHDGVLIGVLYGGIFLNQDHAIVDTVRDTVFLNEEYEGRPIGVASIFLNDTRISTNVLTRDGKRALGSKVSEEVRVHVLEKREKWTQRARVIDDWYITAYEAIRDVHGKNVGIIGLGVLEEKYTDLRWKTLAVFVLIMLTGTALAALLGAYAGRKILNPVTQLIKASQQVTGGSLSPDIGPTSHGEIAVLQNAFREMVAAMGRRTEESQNRLIVSEKQASVGRLAAGVAHEINNPLTGVMTYAHMLLRRKDLADDIRSDLQTIAEATERVRKIVRGLLDFSRETKLEPTRTDVNSLILLTISLIKNQALLKGVRIKFDPVPGLPMLTLDRSQMQSVLMNMIINGLDATETGGAIALTTRKGVFHPGMGQSGIEIRISDTGCGIPKEHMSELFEPFFTTKEVGHGTGLGLSVSLGIVQRHGGTIGVESEVGRGSTFTLWLPEEDGSR
ncbi:MAG: cache domain-containing protein [Desulfobacterales bacterium]|nr:cache domain-containing protein [Desulfobacterales bacterium]